MDRSAIDKAKVDIEVMSQKPSAYHAIFNLFDGIVP